MTANVAVVRYTKVLKTAKAIDLYQKLQRGANLTG